MEFQKFNKIPRLSRDCIITEKLDGSNSQLVIKTYSDLDVSDCQFITKYALNLPENFNEGTFQFLRDEPYIFAGSRKRWLDCSSNGDNYGFAKWVKENAEDLLKLGEGRHYGEWMGSGINRNYGLEEKRFVLFNVGKWHKDKARLVSVDPKTKEERYTTQCPSCCDVVPILYQGKFDTNSINETLDLLKIKGSYAVPGFMNPEGIIIYHTASGQLFKKTLENDEKPKGSKE